MLFYLYVIFFFLSFIDLNFATLDENNKHTLLEAVKLARSVIKTKP